ncbi:MAG: hypothetical protein ACOY42_10915 [Pseudomonadota bacterium]
MKDPAMRRPLRASVFALCGSLFLLALAGCQTSQTAPESPPEAEPIPESQPAVGETEPAPAPATSPKAEPAAPVGEPAQPAVGVTAGERIEALDRKLEASLDEHDAMLRDQQANARAEAAAIAAQQPPGGGANPEEEAFEQGDLYEGLPGFGTPPPEANQGGGSDGGATAAEPEEPGATAAAASTAGARATQGQPGGATVPADIPDGRDDDIVARQLREAAQMEKDPKLREKLWDEYRKYKNQQAAQ